MIAWGSLGPRFAVGSYQERKARDMVRVPFRIFPPAVSH
jgi:hypothetical protein